MDEEIEGSADYYLVHAARIRALAERAVLPEVKKELSKIAIAFERLAKRARHPSR